MLGSATETTVSSTIVMSVAAHSTASASSRVRGMRVCVDPDMIGP